MGSYRKRDYTFEQALSRRADELRNQTSVTTCPRTGRILILELPGFSFSTLDDAIRFLRRVTSAPRHQSEPVPSDLTHAVLEAVTSLERRNQ